MAQVLSRYLLADVRNNVRGTPCDVVVNELDCGIEENELRSFSD